MDKWQRLVVDRYLEAQNGKAELTDEETFWDMFEVLPPENYQNRGGIESFMMMEYTCGSCTQQYARKGDVFITKLVDVENPSTWIRPEHFQELAA